MSLKDEENLPLTRDVVRGAFTGMREYATFAGSIPAEDYSYHCAFPGFTRHVEEQSASLIGIMEQCFSLLPQRRRPSFREKNDPNKGKNTQEVLGGASNLGGGSGRHPLTEAQRTMVMEAIDSMLENVDAALDEVRGNRMRANDQLALTFGSELVPVAPSSVGEENAPQSGRFPSSLSVNTGSGVVQVSRVVRPQLTFKKPVDNSLSPFIPVYADEKGVVHTGKPGKHPFEERIKAFKPPAQQLQPKAESVLMPLDQCPLHFVDTEESLRQMVEKLLAVHEIAVDLEHHDFYSFLGFTCLMQISTRTDDYIVDCLKLREEMKLLAPVFLNPNILKVFHGAREDVRWLQKDFSLYLVNFFDTGIALQTLHMPYSLAFAVDHFCQVKLEKKYQTADWRIRPLPAEMVHYARQDTHFLLYIYDRLQAMLLNAESRASVGNLLLHVYGASKSLSLEQYEKPVFDPDVSYANSLDRSLGGLNTAQRRVARHVFNWRDHAAREVDDSPFAVLHQSSLIAIASKLPQTAKELFQCANPVSAVLRKDVSILIAAIQQIVAEEDGKTTSGSGSSLHNKAEGLDEESASASSSPHAKLSAEDDWQPMGLHRPMTGTLPSIMFSALQHASLSAHHAEREQKATQRDDTSHVGTAASGLHPEVALLPESQCPPSTWLMGMRRIAQCLDRRPALTVPIPGSAIVEMMAQRVRLAQEAADAKKRKQKRDGTEEEPREGVTISHSSSAADSSLSSDEEDDEEGNTETVERLRKRKRTEECNGEKSEDSTPDAEPEKVVFPDGAFSMRQVLGTGAKNRRVAKKAK